MDDPRAARAVAMYAAGVSTGAICADVHCDGGTLARWARAAGLPMRGQRGRPIPVDDPTRRQAIEMYAAGELTMAIYLATGHGGKEAMQWAVEEGIPKRGPRNGWMREPGVLLSLDEILAPGSGDWNLDRALITSARRNAEIVANNYSGFPAS